MTRFPLMALAVSALAAAPWLSAPVASALVYDRQHILAGEFWRIVTGNWVHFSTTHFAYDAFAFAIAGSLIEWRDRHGFGLFCLFSPLLIGLAVFLAQPGLERFGGLSGLATGAVTLLSLRGLSEPGWWRRICLFALVSLAGKIVFEFATGHLAFAQAEGVQPVPASHLAGALGGTMVWLFTGQNTAKTPSATATCASTAGCG